MADDDIFYNATNNLRYESFIKSREQEHNETFRGLVNIFGSNDKDIKRLAKEEKKLDRMLWSHHDKAGLQSDKIVLDPIIKKLKQDYKSAAVPSYSNNNNIDIDTKLKWKPKYSSNSVISGRTPTIPDHTSNDNNSGGNVGTVVGVAFGTIAATALARHLANKNNNTNLDDNDSAVNSYESNINDNSEYMEYHNERHRFNKNKKQRLNFELKCGNHDNGYQLLIKSTDSGIFKLNNLKINKLNGKNIRDIKTNNVQIDNQSIYKRVIQVGNNCFDEMVNLEVTIQCIYCGTSWILWEKDDCGIQIVIRQLKH